MTGRLYIDGVDSYSNYGLFVCNKGYEELVEYPSLKDVNTNDWPEEDGIEPDLLNPVLDTKQFKMDFAVHKNIRTGLFLDAITDGAYHDFNFAEIGRSFKLRLTQNPSFALFNGIELLQFKFSNDFPIPESYTYTPPSSIASNTGYDIDGRDFGRYGIRVLSGSISEVLKMPTVKDNLLINLKNQQGVTYDEEEVFFKSKDVKLNLLMTANSLSEFWQNYDAFIYDLTRPEERTLYADYTGYEYPCFYKSCNTIDFSPVNGKVWFKFTLTLTFITFRRSGEEFELLLAAENGALVITEESSDNDPVYIDLEI